MHRFFKKVFKIVAILFFGVLLTFLVLINIFFQSKSDDEIRDIFSEATIELKLEYQEFKEQQFRVISTRKVLDTTLPNLIFIHGSPGSAMDFKKYLLDVDLNSNTNLIAYERVGYGDNNLGDVKNINFEVSLLNSITEQFNIEKTILAGYSYGGPIALASQKEYKKVILLAPAVNSEIEPMFWFLNLYKWKITRWMMPKMLQTASKEKLNHPTDLKNHEQFWNKNPAEIFVIHGDKDWIVPYENSILLQKQFNADKFELHTIKEAGHDLIWTRFDEIKFELLKVISE
ncbi:MAG: alpha/beta hydrolase [Urechidicola sp.]|nr:alpha/beta hydrolase [Urechidicola sp.]